jgi:hypothetical protein
MTIYVLRSPVFKKNIFKIGFSTQKKEDLIKRYSTSLGAVKIKYIKNFIEYKKKEKELHNLLSKYRIWKRRELFKCNYNVISYNLDLIENKKPSIFKKIKYFIYK